MKKLAAVVIGMLALGAVLCAQTILYQNVGTVYAFLDYPSTDGTAESYAALEFDGWALDCGNPSWTSTTSNTVLYRLENDGVTLTPIYFVETPVYRPDVASAYSGCGVGNYQGYHITRTMTYDDTGYWQFYLVFSASSTATVGNDVNVE